MVAQEKEATIFIVLMPAFKRPSASDWWSLSLLEGECVCGRWGVNGPLLEILTTPPWPNCTWPQKCYGLGKVAEGAPSTHHPCWMKVLQCGCFGVTHVPASNSSLMSTNKPGVKFGGIILRLAVGTFWEESRDCVCIHREEILAVHRHFFWIVLYPL